MIPTVFSTVRAVALLLVLGFPAAGRAAGRDPLLRFHPVAGEVDGLTVVEGSHQHGAGEGLTAIYDGGYQKFTKAGVKRASQRYYTLGGHSVELVIHEVQSEAKARKLFETSCKDGKAPQTSVRLGAKTAKICAAAADGSAYGYLLLGRYYLSSTVDKQAEMPVRSLLQAAGARLAGVKPKGKEK